MIRSSAAMERIIKAWMFLSVPIDLDGGLGAAIFSFAGVAFLWTFPRHLPLSCAPFGTPLPSTSTAQEARIRQDPEAEASNSQPPHEAAAANVFSTPRAAIRFASPLHAKRRTTVLSPSWQNPLPRPRLPQNLGRARKWLRPASHHRIPGTLVNFAANADGQSFPF